MSTAKSMVAALVNYNAETSYKNHAQLDRLAFEHSKHHVRSRFGSRFSLFLPLVKAEN